MHQVTCPRTNWEHDRDPYETKETLHLWGALGDGRAIYIDTRRGVCAIVQECDLDNGHSDNPKWKFSIEDLSLPVRFVAPRGQYSDIPAKLVVEGEPWWETRNANLRAGARQPVECETDLPDDEIIRHREGFAHVLDTVTKIQATDKSTICDTKNGRIFFLRRETGIQIAEFSRDGESNHPELLTTIPPERRQFNGPPRSGDIIISPVHSVEGHVVLLLDKKRLREGNSILNEPPMPRECRYAGVNVGDSQEMLQDTENLHPFIGGDQAVWKYTGGQLPTYKALENMFSHGLHYTRRNNQWVNRCGLTVQEERHEDLRAAWRREQQQQEARYRAAIEEEYHKLAPGGLSWNEGGREAYETAKARVARKQVL